MPKKRNAKTRMGEVGYNRLKAHQDEWCNNWLTFPFVIMTWVDLNGKYHTSKYMSTLEIITVTVNPASTAMCIKQ